MTECPLERKYGMKKTLALRMTRLYHAAAFAKVLTAGPTLEGT